jgi:hypothetical protein
MRSLFICLTIATFVALNALPVHAQLTSPQIGWEAELSTIYHQVSGTVTVLDPNTLLFDNFSFDGGGPAVYFYLGADNSDSAFTTGLSIGWLLSGIAYVETQDSFEIDLLPGQSLEGYNAISVWCVDASVNFGSGEFQPFDPMGDFNGADLLGWQRGESPNPFSQSDLAGWEANYGPGGSLRAVSTAVPEPSAFVLVGGFAAAMLLRRSRPCMPRH